MRCTSCGANIPDTALFCTACGTAVSRPAPEQKPAGLTCVQCGAPIPSGNLFCTACGAKAPAQQAPKQQAAASVPRPGAGGKTCPVCGRVIAPGYAFCTGCGTPVHAARTAAPEPPRPTPMTVCRSCGASVPAGVPYCTACGADMRFGGYEKPKKSRAGLVIGILCALLAAIGIFAALFFTGALDGLLGVNKEPTEQAAAPTEDAAAAAENDSETDSKSEAETETPSPSPSESPEPSPSPSPEAEASDYLLPDSASRALTEADLEDLSWRELCLARNEIFARHGRIFKTPEIAQYFESKDWYDGRYSEVTLSELETNNVNFILSYENRHYGHSYY